MIYDTGHGVYLFLFKSVDDSPSDADYWYESIEEAERHAAEFGICSTDWQPISDPMPGCNDDRIR